MIAQATAIPTNPGLGVLIFTLGGLAGAVFYLPFRKVKDWAWESYWMIYALVGLVAVPWILALATSPNAIAAISHTPARELLYCFLCGAAWGVGGLTWGLMIRYLGVGLGLAIGCGLTSACGTLIPPLLKGEAIFGTLKTNVSLLGVLISILGIVMVGLAGMTKEKELPEEEKKKTVAEYDFKKGLLVAIFSGLMSSAMSLGLQGGTSIELRAMHGSQSVVAPGEAGERPAALAQNAFHDPERDVWIAPAGAPGERVTTNTWRGMPVLVVVLLGGFAVNFLWCLFLNLKNGSLGDYAKRGAPLLPNLLFAGLAGAIWCSQFICFKTGEPAMGKLSYVGWAVLMASAILFSSLLGMFLGEWNGTSPRTRTLLATGLILLVTSSAISASVIVAFAVLASALVGLALDRWIHSGSRRPAPLAP